VPQPEDRHHRAQCRWRARAARFDGTVVPRREQRPAQKRTHLSEPRLISEGLGVDLRFTKDVVDPREVPERVQRMAELYPHVNGMLEVLPMLREVPEDFQCLLEVPQRLVVGRAREGLGARLTQVGQRLVPHLAVEGMVGEALDLFSETIAIEPLDGVHDPGMQGAASLVEKALIGDLVREGVLEGVLDLGEQARLVDELGPLKPGPKLILCQIGDGMEQRRRHILANDGGDLQQALVFWSEAIDARGQHGVHGGRNLDRLDRLNKPIASPFSQQRLRLHEGPDALLQEERVAAPAEELLERSETGIVAEQRVQELPRRSPRGARPGIWL